MADLEIRIELDRDPPRFQPGDRITGTVHVRAEAGVDARKVWVRRVYRTSGPGTPAMGDPENVTLDEERQQLGAGDERSYPFELNAPAGPPSQSGEMVTVDWVVHAGVDLPRFKFETTFEPFELADTVVPAGAKASPSEPRGELRSVRLADLPAGEAEAIRALPAVGWLPADADAEKRARWYNGLPERAQGCVKTCWGCMWAPFLLIPLMPLLVGINLLRDGQTGLGAALLVIGLTISGIWIFMADRYTGGAIRRWLSERTFGSFALKAKLDELRRGGPLVWFAQVDPHRAVTVRRASARLELEERMSLNRARSGGGKGTTLKKVSGTHTFTLDDAIEVSRGEEVLIAGNLTLPVSWPASLYGNSEFRWTLYLDLELDGGPDWHGQVRLDVR